MASKIFVNPETQTEDIQKVLNESDIPSDDLEQIIKKVLLIQGNIGQIARSIFTSGKSGKLPAGLCLQTPDGIVTLALASYVNVSTARIPLVKAKSESLMTNISFDKAVNSIIQGLYLEYFIKQTRKLIVTRIVEDAAQHVGRAHRIMLYAGERQKFLLKIWTKLRKRKLNEISRSDVMQLIEEAAENYSLSKKHTYGLTKQ